MIASSHELLAELRARGLAGEGEAAGAPPPDRPWYIGLLLGIAGWFAGAFLLVFIGLLFKPHDAAALLFIGLVLLAAAWGLFRLDRDGAFLSQLALALSIAGQFATVAGLGEWVFKGWREAAVVAFVAFTLQAALVFAMPNRLHRTLSAFFACIAWALFVRYALWDGPPWGGASRVTPSLPKAIAGWLCAWMPVGVLLYMLIRREPAWMAAGREAIARPAAAGLVAGLAFGTLLSQPFEAFSLFLGSTPDTRPGWLSIWPLLSAAASVAALAAAFALGARGLMATCIVAALLHLSHFYYTMGTTLLTKSVTMLVLGAVLLAAAHHLGRQRE